MQHVSAVNGCVLERYKGDQCIEALDRVISPTDIIMK